MCVWSLPIAPRDVAVYSTDRDACARLQRLPDLANRRTPKGKCHLNLQDWIDNVEGQLLIV